MIQSLKDWWTGAKLEPIDPEAATFDQIAKRLIAAGANEVSAYYSSLITPDWSVQCRCGDFNADSKRVPDLDVAAREVYRRFLKFKKVEEAS